ncbi:MAG: lytic transglycosylase domain-containing protein [Pseudomonadota bacterium]
MTTLRPSVSARPAIAAGAGLAALLVAATAAEQVRASPDLQTLERTADAGARNAAASKERIKRELVAAALRHGVPPELALAVARVESGLKPDALSSAGARGVMQIMPATARGEFGVQADALWDPRTNIDLGVRYLAKLYAQYGERWDAALSHYNGGSLNGDDPFTAKPHARTADYVDAVLAHQERYEWDERVLLMIADARVDVALEDELDGDVVATREPIVLTVAERAEPIEPPDAPVAAPSIAVDQATLDEAGDAAPDAEPGGDLNPEGSSPAAPFRWYTAWRAQQLALKDRARMTPQAGPRGVVGRDPARRALFDRYAAPSRFWPEPRSADEFAAIERGRSLCDCDAPPSDAMRRRYEIVKGRFDESMRRRQERSRQAGYWRSVDGR